MRIGGVTLEELNDNINTICSLNDNKNTCLPENIIYALNDNKEINKKPNIIINKLANKCNCDSENNISNKELCIIKKINNIDNNTKDCILYRYFKPEGDYDGNAWLNNTHIDIIQEQLYKKYSGYYYGFIHMIDNVMISPNNMKCINHPVKSITELDFTKIINYGNDDLKWYGVVYNTDPSNKGGQHWFSILLNFSTKGTDLDPYMIEYFNSSGLDIQNIEFRKFLHNLAFKISYETNKKMIFKKITNIQHQSIFSGNCGIYSLYYIWSRLEGVPIETFNNPKKIITDKMMEHFRKVMFRMD